MVAPSHPLLLTPWKTHALGVCDKTTQTIYVDKTLKPRKQKEILCHEIVHATIFSYGIELSVEDEEFIADLIAKHGNEIIKLTDRLFNQFKK
mgnify:CR=1 FL=1